MLEAILVALLVLTAILFFTNVQRPSTGASEGGLDLAQVSADTLQILQLRTFTVSGQAQTFNGWVTNATAGDSATVAAVDTFIRQVIPTGAHYSLRLDNGVSTLQILPAGTTETPRNARASEVVTMPSWTAFRNSTVAGTTMTVVSPGQLVDASNALVSGAYLCYEAPNGYTTGPGGVQWSTRWTSAVQATEPTTNGKATSAVLGTSQQVPRDLPYGKWKVATLVGVGSPPHCTAGTVAYVDVVPAGSRAITVATTLGSKVITATAATARFSSQDVGLAVSGTGIAANSRIDSVQSSSQATLNNNAVSSSPSTDLSLPADPTFMPYGIQLVVWFGA